MRDLIIHVADQHMEKGLRAFFGRDNWHRAIGCARFDLDSESESEIYRVPGCTDGGVWKQAHENLEPFRAKYRRAVVLLDADFDPHPGAEVLQKDISDGMIGCGWQPDDFAVIVIQPELEAWLWAPNQNVALAFGVQSFDELRKHLEEKRLWNPGEPKPHDLKGARDAAARLGGKKTGGPIFKSVLEGVSRRAMDHCVEPGLITFRETLLTWYPSGGGE